MSESADIIARDARKAAELQPDVGAEKIGEIYAKALLGAAQAADQTTDVLAQFDAVVADVLDRFPKLADVLGSPLVGHDERVRIIDRVFGGQIGPTLLNFFKVVSRHGRLDCVRAIHREAHRLYEESLGRVRVRLTTATPLDAAQIDKITQDIRAALGREPILQSAVDPELIGGAVLRVDDTVYDGSIANQLQFIRQQMIDRSVHEIQSRRDRFRNSAGS
jgi:F-type H+-transporting ATPase subunit delta